ncbi:hypothetical protein [Streptomyces griseochromogenes]|uniref:hypothetical protein n=1 Tax=Streptomyces griseochromogenes TaxID=68214 RepID=UPI0037BD1F72
MGAGKLTYQDVVTADLGALITAAQDWDEMAGGFDDLGTLYGAQVEAFANDGRWVAVSADAAASQFAVTRKQFADAQTEARAIASLLRETYERFSQLIGRVRDLVGQAEKDNMTVNSKGEAVYDLRKLAPFRSEPDYAQYVAQVQKAEVSWTKKIRDAVQAVDEEDEIVERALCKAAGIESWFQRILDPLNQNHSFNGAADGDIATYEQEAKKEEAEERAEEERKRQEKEARGRTLKHIVGGIIKGATIFSQQPGGLGTKLVGTAIEGIAGVTGYNNTQGITIGGSLGFGVGISGSISLVETRTPDGRNQLNLMYSGGETTAGWDFGASANIGVVKSNADDISQLKGAGWDKSGSFHVGPGIWGAYQNAIGTTNSKGDPVGTASYGGGIGLGNEVATGFSNADGWTLWESGKGK